MRIGYARVSTKDQSFDLQVDALEKAGCEKIYKEIASGAKAEREVLNDLLKNIRSEDELFVWKLDRLGRSLKHLVELINDLIAKQIGFCSLNDPINTTSAQGKLIFNIFASLSEFERDLIKERTQAGLKAARKRGRFGGRPKGLSKTAQATACAVEALYREGKLSVNEIAEKLNISKGTLYSYLRYRQVPIGSYKT